MFYKQFIQLCKINNELPSNVLKTLGISSGNLSNWKRGTSVRSEILILLSDYFNVSVDYLLGREKQNATNVNDDNNSQIVDSTVIGVITRKQCDETANQVAEEFLKLSFLNKIKVMNLIAELNDNKDYYGNTD